MNKLATLTDQAGFFFLTLYIFFAPFKVLYSLGEITLGLTVLAAALHLWAAGRQTCLKRPRPGKLGLAIGLWVLAALASLPTALEPLFSLGEIRKELFKPLFMGLAAYGLVRDTERFRRVTLAILASSLVMALSGGVEMAGHIQRHGWAAVSRNIDTFRVAGLGRYIHEYMTSLLLALPFWLALTVSQPRGPRRWAAGAGALIVICGHSLGFGRTQTLALILVLGVFALLCGQRWRVVAPGLLLGLAAAVFFSPRAFWTVSPNEANRLVATKSDEVRWPMLQLAWARIKEHPLAGIGFGYSAFQFLTQNRPPDDPVRKHLHPHNYYLTITLGLGLQGLAAFLFLLVQTVKSIWPGLRLPRPPSWPDLGRRAALCALAGLLFINLTDTLLVGRTLIWLWVVLGAVLGVNASDAARRSS